MADFYEDLISGNPVITYYDPSPPMVGEIKSYAGATAPSGWAICNGQELSQATYPDLFALLGSTYNTQTNPTTGSAWAAPSAGTFRVPDLRGIFLRGVGSPNAGSTVTLGGFQDDQMQGHYHNLRMGYGAASGDRPATTSNGASTSTDTVSGGAFTQVNDGTNGTPRTGLETRPKNRGVTYIIRLFNPTAVAYGAGWATGLIPGLTLDTGTVELVATGTSLTNVRSSVRARGDKNGKWRLEGNIYVTRSGTAVTSQNISLPGVVFKNTTSFFQVITAGSNGAAGAVTGYVNPNTGNFTVEHASFNTTIYYITFNVELESKPTWAT